MVPPDVPPAPAPVVPLVPLAPLPVPAAPPPSDPPRLQPPSISINATAESATRTLVDEVFIIHPFLWIEEPLPRKAKTLKAAWLLDIDVLERALFRQKLRFDRPVLISIKIQLHRFPSAIRGAVPVSVDRLFARLGQGGRFFAQCAKNLLLV